MEKKLWDETLRQSTLLEAVADSLVVVGGRLMEMKVSWQAVDENSDYAYKLEKSVQSAD